MDSASQIWTVDKFAGWGYGTDWFHYYNITSDELSNKSRSDIYYQNLIHEIFTSEVDYLGSLEVLLYLYRDELRRPGSQIIPLDQRRDFVEAVFGKVQVLYDVNRVLLSEFVSLQEKHGAWIPGIGDAFRKWLPEARAAYWDYFGSYPIADLLAKQQLQDNPMFRELEKSIVHGNARSKRLGLNHFLNSPTSRLTKYLHFFRNLDRCLLEDSDEKQSLRAATEDLRAVMAVCGERLGESTKRAEMMRTAYRLVMPVSLRQLLDLDEPSRSVLMQGPLQMSQPPNGKWRPILVILLDNALLFVQEVKDAEETSDTKYRFLEHPILLTELTLDRSLNAPVDASRGSSNRFRFSLRSERLSRPDLDFVYPFEVKHGNKSYSLAALTPSNRKEWCDKILQAQVSNGEHAALSPVLEPSSSEGTSSSIKRREAIYVQSPDYDEIAVSHGFLPPAADDLETSDVEFSADSKHPNALNEPGQEGIVPLAQPQSREQEDLVQPGPVRIQPSPQPSESHRFDPGPLYSDLVQDMKLTATFVDGKTLHIYHARDTRVSRHHLRVEEHWKEEHMLGRGSFGAVYLESCVDGPKRGELRAVKKIFKEAHSPVPIDYSRELIALAKFSHEKYAHCFVQSYGWWETADSVFIAMEYFQKGDLQNYLVVPFPEDTTKEITLQLLEGLVFMHENGFAHRDLKPGNILVFRHEPDWWVKISDFGISKRINDNSTSLHTQIGTRMYLAPEVQGVFTLSDMELAQGEQRPYSLAVDIWSLGTIVYRMISNRVPFPDPWSLAQFVTIGKPLPKDSLTAVNASTEAVNFLEKCLMPSASARPSATQLSSDPWTLSAEPEVLKYDPRQEEQHPQQHQVPVFDPASNQWTTQ